MNLFTKQTRKAAAKRFVLVFLTLLALGFKANAQIPTFSEILKQYYNTDNLILKSSSRSTPYGQQFGNYTFEEWETVNSSYLEPVNWNSFMTADGKSTLKKYLKDQIAKSTEIRPGSTGSYSARIFSTSTNIIITKIIANANMTTGQIYAGSTTANNDGNYNFTKRSDDNFNTVLTTIPDSLTVWVAFKPKDASKGNARITTTIHGDADLKQQAKSGDSPTDMVCATANQEIEATSTSAVVWKRVTIPFVAGPHNDPRYILTTFNTNKTPGGGSEGDELYIDDICLIYNPSLEMDYLAQTEFDGSNMNIEVPFTLDGSMSVYNLNAAANEVIAQLSDADGSFANPIELGRVTTDVSGTINGVIPADLVEGTYKVRVVSTNYPMESNESDITIKYPYVAVPQVEITKGDVLTYSLSASFAPNADCAQYYFLISAETVDAEYIKENGELKSESYAHTWENLMPNTNYTIYVLPIDIENNEGTVNTLVVKTRVEAGVSEIYFDIEKLNETTVTITATPNENTVLYHYIVITKAEADSIGEEALMQKLNENENYIDSVAYEFTMTVESNVEYYFVAQGKNRDDKWGEVTKAEFVVAGPATVAIEVKEISETSVEVTATPNENAVSYKYIVIEKAEADAMETEALMQKLAEANELTAVDVWTYTVKSNVAYYVVAQAKNADDMFGEIAKVEFMVEYTDTTAVAEFDEAMFEVYPNPASEYVRISSDVEIESLIIFSMDGKMVYSQDVNQEETMIDVTGFAKGSYIVRILSNDRFVVRRIMVK